MFPCKDGVQFFYCFEDFNFTLRGYFQDQSTYISLSLYVCNNETSNNTCQSIETIRAFLANKILAIQYMDHTLDLNNYEEPVQNYLKMDFFYIDANNRKNTAIYLKKVALDEDNNIFYYQNKLKLTTFVKDYSVNDFAQIVLHDLKTPLAQYMFYSSENLNQIQRSYQKLGQMLAFLSGIHSLLKIMGAVIIHLRVRYMIQNTIMGFLYDLDFSHLKKTQRQVKSNTIQKDIEKTNPKHIMFKSEEKIKKQSNQKYKRPYIEGLWSKFKINFNMMLTLFFHKNYQEEYFNLTNLKQF